MQVKLILILLSWIISIEGIHGTDSEVPVWLESCIEKFHLSPNRNLINDFLSLLTIKEEDGIHYYTEDLNDFSEKCYEDHNPNEIPFTVFDALIRVKQCFHRQYPRYYHKLMYETYSMHSMNHFPGFMHPKTRVKSQSEESETHEITIKPFAIIDSSYH